MLEIIQMFSEEFNKEVKKTKSNHSNEATQMV